MITINLLPADLRPIERTPLPRFLVIIVGLTLGLVGVVFLTFMQLIFIPRAHDAVVSKDAVLANLRQQAVKYQKVTAELKDITQRESSLQAIYKTRTIWWEKLDLLCDLIPSSYIGLTALSFIEPASGAGPAAAAANAGTLKLECIAAKAEEKRVASFRRILKGEIPPEWGNEAATTLGKEFIADFVNEEILDYGWKVVQMRDYGNQSAIQFNLEMKLKPKVAPPAARPAAGARPAQTATPAGTGTQPPAP
jgi:Tfp pilus assembly protein PilN